jgi:hypothetical protein
MLNILNIKIFIFITLLYLYFLTYIDLNIFMSICLYVLILQIKQVG